jgi:hypothetical protein
MRVVGIYWAIRDSASSRVKLDWIAPQVVAVQLDEVKGVEKDALVSAVVPDEIERSRTVVIMSRTALSSCAVVRAE